MPDWESGVRIKFKETPEGPVTVVTNLQNDDALHFDRRLTAEEVETLVEMLRV